METRKRGSIGKKTCYRLGLFSADPDDKRVKYISGRLRDTPENRRMMKASVEKYQEIAANDPSVVLCMGVFRVGG